METKGHQHFISQEVFLRDASPDTIRLELYADGIIDDSAVKYEMTRARQLPDRACGYVSSLVLRRPCDPSGSRVDPLAEMTASSFRNTTDLFELMRESCHLD